MIYFYLFITFRVRRRRREMYIGHARLYVSLRPSLHAHTTAPIVGVVGGAP